jgi:hypothetical protein
MAVCQQNVFVLNEKDILHITVYIVTSGHETKRHASFKKNIAGFDR